MANVAAAANGGTVAATSSVVNFAASGSINGDRTTTGWGANGGWASLPNLTGAAPGETLTVTFNAAYWINEIDVITYGTAGAPTLTDTIGGFGITDYTVQYWNGSSWVVLATVTANDKVWRQFTFSAVNTTSIRVNITTAQDNTARILELEAWDTAGPPPPSGFNALLIAP